MAANTIATTQAAAAPAVAAAVAVGHLGHRGKALAAAVAMGMRLLIRVAAEEEPRHLAVVEQAALAATAETA